MIKPDDDFDDDFDDGDPIDEETAEDVRVATTGNSNQKQHDTRRRIEDILERKRLREEFGDLEL